MAVPAAAVLGAVVLLVGHSNLAASRALLHVHKDPARWNLVKKYEGLDKWLFNGQSFEHGAATSAGLPSAPLEDMHDGNTCGDDEELLNDLCYAKCSLLTHGSHPIRTSSFSCCESHPCSITNTKVNMKPCAGFDVAGNINGEEGACPHPEGTCLQDEEVLLGMCYKKCSDLTQGKYPHRLAATTCCSTTGFGCLNPSNLKTDFFNFPVGGGEGDGNKATPAAMHPPLTSLTEKGLPTTEPPASA